MMLLQEAANTWSNRDFQNIEYKGDQTGGGDPDATTIRTLTQIPSVR